MSTERGLVANWKFNQGSAGGNNAAITQATDSIGNSHASFTNMPRTGAGSNIVAGYALQNTCSSPAPITSTISPVVCGSYTSPSGKTWTTSNTYMDTILNYQYCRDSVITINLTVNTPTSSNISPAVCDSYTSPSGKVWTMSNTYMDTIPNANNCDSVITINLTINTPTSSSISPAVCGSYTSPSGKVWTMSNTYMDTIPNANNCDSVITINLTVNTATSSSISPAVCGSYTSPSGKVWTMSNTYMDTIPNANNCDSVITIILTVNTSPAVTLSNLGDVCENTPTFALSGGTPAGGTYSGTNVQGGNYTVPTGFIGVDTVEYSYTDGNGCSNKASGTIEINRVDATSLSLISGVCNSEDSVELTGGLPVGGTYSGPNVSGINFDASVATIGVNAITYTYTNADNCTDSSSANIEVVETPDYEIEGPFEGCGASGLLLQTNASDFVLHEWSTGDTTDTTNVKSSGDVWVKFTDSSTVYGCYSYDTVQVVYDSICAGITNPTVHESITVYPNPTSGIIHIESTITLDGLSYKLLTSSGQLLNNSNVSNSGRIEGNTLNLSSLESGVYFLLIEGSSSRQMNRIVIQH